MRYTWLEITHFEVVNMQSRVRWGGMCIKTGIFEMIIKQFKSDIQQLKNNR